MKALYEGKASKIIVDGEELEINKEYDITVDSPSRFSGFKYDISIRGELISSYKDELKMLDDWKLGGI